MKGDGGKGYVLQREETALLVIDMQERLLAAMPERDATISAAAKMMDGCRCLGVPIVVTEQYPRGLGPTVAELKERMHGDASEKLHFDCCGEEGFLAKLQSIGRSQVVVCGSETHICVLQTCLSLLDAGFAVHVLADAVCSRKDIDRETALLTLRQAGARVSTVETALFQMLRAAGSAEFKEISRLVR